jgi:ABC-2 type transport system permease protein
VTNTGVNTARPPLGLAMSSLLRADSIVLLNGKTSVFLSILLPIVILVANSFGKGQSRLGGSTIIIGLALTLGLLTTSLFGYTLALAHDREIGVLQRLRVTPAPTWMIMTSRLVVQVATNLVASVIVVIVGALMTLFADVLNQSPWTGQDTYSLLACAGYIIVFAFIGIRWFRWNSR